MTPKDEKTLSALQKQIGHQFNDKSLLLVAITHRSFARDERLKSNIVAQNERLEFLGDAILSMVSAHELYTDLPKADEGTLTQLRANYVCETHLAQCGKDIGLGKLLRVAASMQRAEGVELPSIISDAVEAIIGAVYLDAGLDPARKTIRKVLGPVPKKLVSSPKDPKTQLQEWTQAKVGSTPIYEVTESSGPPHMPIFVVEVSVKGRLLASGQGSSKKEAAQEAARAALADIEKVSKPNA